MGEFRLNKILRQQISGLSPKVLIQILGGLSPLLPNIHTSDSTPDLTLQTYFFLQFVFQVLITDAVTHQISVYALAILDLRQCVQQREWDSSPTCLPIARYLSPIFSWWCDSGSGMTPNFEPQEVLLYVLHLSRQKRFPHPST